MFDERIFRETNEKGICFVKSATNEDEAYLLVKIDNSNKRLTGIGDKFLIVNIGDEDK